MALGAQTFTSAGAAVSDLFAASASKTKAIGDRLEAGSYDEAAILADQNAAFTKESTGIKVAQQSRNLEQVIGLQEGQVSAQGFGESGSALDLLRDSASQGAMANALTQRQGQITEAGYHQQADSYRTMSQVANFAAAGEDKAAKGHKLAAYINGAAAVFSLFPGMPSGGGGGNPVNVGSATGYTT